MRNMSKICYIASASIAVVTEYNKDPNAEFIVIDNSDIDAIVEYFKDHAVYQYCADLIMDGQLKFKGKPVIAYIGQPIGSNKGDIGSMTAEEMKRMLNKVYGAGMFHKEAADV
jgi:hypothetical protein